MSESPSNLRHANQLVLLTGATGYVGGRLLTRLLDAGYVVRCMARQPRNISQTEGQNYEVVRGDLLDFQTLVPALKGVRVAYYLAHSLGSAKEFEQKEIACAKNFARAAEEAGVERIIYLGGLGEGSDLSPHLKTRHEVGRILRQSKVKTIELRASIIIGSGSLSFELVRALVAKLPVMITPKWVRAKAQPIAIEDVLGYLLECAEMEISESRTFEIGGPDVVSYAEIMREYARQRGVYLVMIPVPVLTPWLSSLWLGLVTPIYARVGRKLIDSVRNNTLVLNHDALQMFTIKPRGLKEAIERALRNEDLEFARTRWSDALSSSGDTRSWGGVKLGNRLVDSRFITLKATSQEAFAPIRRIGGKNGWYYADWAWSFRGFIDLLCGGVGVRRGRANSEYVRVGDALDFWRVEAVESGKLLRLRAEMKVPGRAWLQFEVQESEGTSAIRQTAIFDPHGLLGIVYWYALYPIHNLIFQGMLNGIGARVAGTNGEQILPAG